LLASCQAVREPAEVESVVAATEAAQQLAGSAVIDVSLRFAFEELRAAVEEDEDEVARAILRRLMPRISDTLSQKLADGYGQILAGRSARDAINAEVIIDELAEGGFAVSLALSQGLFDAMTLTPNHVKVHAVTRSIDLAGRQSVYAVDRFVEVVEGWSLMRDQLGSVSLGSDLPNFGDGLLAVRCEWKVVLGAGSVEVPAGVFPLMGVKIRDGAVVRLSKELPTQAVEPEELLRYCLEPVVRVDALLERTVRISPDRYEETLDLIGKGEPGLSPARIQELSPSLAWLTGSSAMRANASEWREWLQDRAVAGDRSESLDLPDASMGSDL
jgi:hypothetical protein